MMGAVFSIYSFFSSNAAYWVAISYYKARKFDKPENRANKNFKKADFTWKWFYYLLAVSFFLFEVLVTTYLIYFCHTGE